MYVFINRKKVLNHSTLLYTEVEGTGKCSFSNFYHTLVDRSKRDHQCCRAGLCRVEPELECKNNYKQNLKSYLEVQAWSRRIQISNTILNVTFTPRAGTASRARSRPKKNRIRNSQRGRHPALAKWMKAKARIVRKGSVNGAITQITIPLGTAPRREKCELSSRCSY